VVRAWLKQLDEEPFGGVVPKHADRRRTVQLGSRPCKPAKGYAEGRTEKGVSA
jgi:hypothetical protein